MFDQQIGIDQLLTTFKLDSFSALRFSCAMEESTLSRHLLGRSVFQRAP
jgi:hypothetical protein